MFCRRILRLNYLPCNWRTSDKNSYSFRQVSYDNSSRRNTCTYPSSMSLWNGAGLSHTGHIHVAFFSFIIRNVVASKHWRCVHVLALHGNWILILPNWNLRKTKAWYRGILYSRVLESAEIKSFRKDLLVSPTLKKNIDRTIEYLEMQPEIWGWNPYFLGNLGWSAMVVVCSWWKNKSIVNST